MKLLALRTSAHRGAPERHLELTNAAGEAQPIVAITGPSGAGKTTLLELIVLHKEHIASYGRIPGARDVLGDGYGRVDVESTWLLDKEEQDETGSATDRLDAFSIWSHDRNESHADPALVHILSRYRHGRGWGKVDYAPTARIVDPTAGAVGDSTTWQRKHRLSLGNEKYAGLSKLVASAGGDLRGELSALLERLTVGLSLQPGEKLLFDTPHGSRKLSELSLTQRLVFRLAATVVLVGLHRSVMLIDALELGLPPGDALSVLRALVDYAPTTQFIITTQDRSVLEAPEVAAIGLEQA